MFNVKVLGEHQNGPLEAFVYFLDEIGIEKKSFVIPDTSALHPYIYDFFSRLTDKLLKSMVSSLFSVFEAEIIASIVNRQLQ